MNRCTITISSRAKKYIESLPDNLKARIANALYNILAPNPFLGKALKADLKGRYSYRVGDYRIIYSIVKHELIIQIIKVSHRREVYR
ncbi:MAG: type II toxin-antitoxin system RelE/ParE family toxin [Candidatus Omnitrophota bacterium]|nr:type II toxin-antitoxin system RelE/ParE family toxin [Candidatus Omnitrophota bacterium]